MDPANVSGSQNAENDPLDKLLRAIKCNNYAKVARILNKKPGLCDREADNGWTPLHFAIERGNYQVTKLLLKADKIDQHDMVSKKDHKGRNARDLAGELGESNIVKMIDYFCSPEAPPDFLRGWSFSESSNTSISNFGKGSGFAKLPISCLIEDFRKNKGACVSWSHLPANNWRWLQLMLETGETSVQDKSLLQHIERKFELSRPLARGRDFFMGQTPTRNDQGLSGDTGSQGPSSVSGSSGPRNALRFSLHSNSSEAPTSPSTPRGSGMSSERIIGDPRSLMTVLPVIDIDLLDGYADPMENLGQSEAPLLKENVLRLYRHDYNGLVPSQTLDNYYQDDLDGQALGKLNESQVFTRYMEKVHDSVENQANNGTQPRRILIVSQFWVLRTNNSLVTSFPKRRGERRDESHGTKTPDQNLQLPRVIRRAFNSAKDPEVIYHDMVKKAIQYQPTIKIRYKHATYTATYLEIFSKEVQRISQKTAECYDEFKQTLGFSEKHFERLSNIATICLLEIDDVCSEVKIIQRVLDDRKRVWRQFHTKKFHHGQMDGDDDYSEDETGSSSHSTPRRCRWGVQNCRPDVVEASLRSDLLEINNSAGAVREKVHGLVTLLHGQASTEIALTASEQAKYLLIFTLLTVVFSPLSFVTSLLALQVESFTPTEWAQGDVTVACVVSVIVTIMICISYYYWMKCGKSRCKRLYEPFLKPCWQPLMAYAQSFKKERQRDRGDSETRHSIASILSDRHGKPSHDLENGTVK